MSRGANGTAPKLRHRYDERSSGPSTGGPGGRRREARATPVRGRALSSPSRLHFTYARVCVFWVCFSAASNSPPGGWGVITSPTHPSH